MGLHSRKVFSFFPPLNSRLKYGYLHSGIRQPAGMGAPIHRFCHPIPGGSVSLKFDTFFNRTWGGELFLRTRRATLNTRGVRAFAERHCKLPVGFWRSRPEPTVINKIYNNSWNIFGVSGFSRKAELSASATYV